ncbi:hypothetical protein AB0L49_37000 [Streptomyces antimycoticus]|uniref:hypothetical protein n=1 Tax=Streptomyces antimycoticus TaxID=68175 RepID=UPI00343EA766
MKLPSHIARDMTEAQNRLLRLRSSQAWYRRRADIEEAVPYDEGVTQRRLAELFSIARNEVPRYSFLRDRINLDLGDFPLTRKSDLRDRFPDFIARGPVGQMAPGRYVINQTTGSTGRPLQILTTVESAALSRNIVSERLFRYLDLPDTGTVFNLGLHYWGQPFFEPKALPRPYIQCNLRGYDPDRAEIVADYEAVVGQVPVDYIHGSSSRIVILARYCLERGIRLEPRGVVATYEHMPAGGRKLVEEIFGCPVTMLYCTSEIGYAAWECREKRMHFHDDFVQCEIFPASEKNRERGAGDIILTSLLSGPMPIIRYVTGDLAAPAAHCSCGLPGTVIDELLGRDGACLVGIEGASYSPYALLAALTATGLADFQLVQESPGVVQVVAPNASASEREAIIHINERLRVHFGPNQGFSVSLSPSTSFTVSGRGKRNPVVQHMGVEIGNTEKSGYIRP